MPTRIINSYAICIICIAFSCWACGKAGEKSKRLDDVMVQAEGNKDMILLTDRPPNLETPLKYFLLDYTPNDVFFVRWHLPVLPNHIQEDTFRLRIMGAVNQELALSMNDLKTQFEKVSVVALAACAGNARSFHDPKVPGGQWKNGAMGNAKWTGVRLKDILEKAGLKKEAFEITFNGMDLPNMNTVPDFIKSLKVDHAMDGEVMIAYAMNDEPLPILNGYPLKLVVPGWYATYWVGMLNEINVVTDTFDGYWMKKAYLKPKGVSNANESPDSLSKDLEPVTVLDVRSIFVTPEPDSVLRVGDTCEIQGLAFDSGQGIVKVEISTDDGQTWQYTLLDPEIGQYAWRRWRFTLIPKSNCDLKLKVRATNAAGETQPEHHWNRSGYLRNEIESLQLEVR
jgi:DMSO/TMAO reductase YedYZ molybdopterin-dependent catalytic subunit